MNKHTNPTLPAPEAIDPNLSAMMDLESHVCDVENVVGILAELLDHYLIDYPADGEKRGPNDNYRIVLTHGDMNRLAFLWNDALHRATLLRKSFYAASDAEGGAA